MRKHQTKDEKRKAKELEEARKAGTAPAEVDEDGKEINPHIPQYIAQAPWYIDQGRPSLKHQRTNKEGEKESISQWYKRGAKKGPAAEKYRKGACSNCGAMSHEKKDCVERPRKTGAKFTNNDIQPDEVITEVELDYEGKHDRWNGYDPANHFQLIDSFQKVEEERQREKEKKLLEGKTDEHAEDEDDPASSDDDEFKDAHEVQSGQKFDVKTRTTIRNLRIREDTAKYLWNLDPNSAYYDPKSRSMRANPIPSADPKDLVYAGDNFVRMNGDALGFKEIERFAWDGKVLDQGVHLQAVPSQAELYHRQFKEKKETLKSQTENEVLKRYAGEKREKELPAELRFAQTEEYYEYAPDGRVIKGQEIQATKSKYEEDLFPGNHQSIWGSYWENGQWGFSCCHSLVKNSYCTGEAGKKSKETVTPQQPKVEKDLEKPKDVSPVRSALRKSQEDEKDDQEKKRKRSSEEKGREGKERKKKKKHAEKEEEADERKRSYNSMYDIKPPTEEELEEYQRTKERWDDPMRGMA